MAVTGALLGEGLRAVGAGTRLVRPLDELAAGADGALRQAPPGLTAVGAASFLATCCQESDYLRTSVEYGKGQRYAPYIGRGFVQLTWERNYAGFGRWARGRGLVEDSAVFVKNPGALADLRWAWLVATYYFETCALERPVSLWPHANRGDHYAVSQGVNRGPGAIGGSKAPLHWSARKRMFDALLRAGDALLPSGAAAPAAPPPSVGPLRYGVRDDPATERWQAALKEHFPRYAGDLVVDGRYGDATKKATAEFQRRAGVSGRDADGSVVGPRTAEAARRIFGWRG